MDRLNLVWDNLKKLGGKKLAALGLTFLLVATLLGVGGYYVSRPSFETLYGGLDREDVSRIGSVLKSAGVPFDVNPEGNAVSVHYGQTAQARMLLAEHGLPQSANAGYELFDKVGALGLTSFMQEVTRVRAIEGELARTIQLIRGVKAARVHIVMPDEGSFRRAKQPPSASVVIRTEGPDDSSAAQAIRHLVAASLPGMTVDQVTVLNTDGMILTASDGDATDAVPAKTLTLEKAISKDIQDNIRKTLTPYLRLPNFQVSVRARINTDRRQINETIYDPESKVERSVRTVKENSTSQNASSSASTTVERNVPQNQTPPSDGKQSNDESKKSEELTNYEMSTKTVTTVSGGYTIENLAIAVLVNRGAFGDGGKSPPSPETVDKQLREIEQIVSSAAGVKKDRGDALKVTAVDFNFSEKEMSPVEAPGLLEHFGHNLGTIINAATLLAITGLIIAFGLRPATRALLAEQPPAIGAPMEETPMIDAAPSLEFSAPDSSSLPIGGFPGIEGFAELAPPSPRQKLEQLIDTDEAQAAAILKEWMHMEDAA
jgi:flagellar M-ring protein FliF